MTVGITGLPLTGYYDYRLVASSIAIAILAAYAAVDLSGRMTVARGRSRLAWLCGGAFAMGVGIWSMHYMGMEAFRLPVLVRYDWPTVVLSMVAAILASAVALFVVTRIQSQHPGGSGWQRPHGRRHRIHALHRDACHAAPRRVRLFPWGSGVVHTPRYSHFVSGHSSDLRRPRRGLSLGLAEVAQRSPDGPGYSGGALCGHGRGDLCFRPLAEFRAWPMPSISPALPSPP